MWYGLTIKALNGVEDVHPPTDFLAQLNSRIDSSSPSFLSFFSSMLESIRTTVSLTPHIPLPIGVSALTAIVVVGVVLFNWHPSVTPTIADQIGADSFTIESAKVDDAVDSLKRILPVVQGQIRNEYSNAASEKVFSVVIPQENYANLTTELVNYGAVVSGAGGKDRSPRKDGSNVILYIRFVPAH